MNGARHRCRLGTSPSGGTSVRAVDAGEVAGEPTGGDHPPWRRRCCPGRRGSLAHSSAAAMVTVGAPVASRESTNRGSSPRRRRARGRAIAAVAGSPQRSASALTAVAPRPRPRDSAQRCRDRPWRRWRWWPGPVPQHLADVDQRRAAAQQLGWPTCAAAGARRRAHPARRQARWTTSPTRSARIGPRGALRSGTPAGVGRAARRQVAGQRLADVSGQRQPVLAAALPRTASSPARQSRSSSSIRATSIERRPEPRDQQHDRVVRGPRGSTGRTSPAAARRRRAPSWPGSRCRASPRPKVPSRPASLSESAQIEEPQQRPQLGDAALGRPSRDPAAFGQQESVDLATGHRSRPRPLRRRNTAGTAARSARSAPPWTRARPRSATSQARYRPSASSSSPVGGSGGGTTPTSRR